MSAQCATNISIHTQLLYIRICVALSVLYVSSMVAPRIVARAAGTTRGSQSSGCLSPLKCQGCPRHEAWQAAKWRKASWRTFCVCVCVCHLHFHLPVPNSALLHTYMNLYIYINIFIYIHTYIYVNILTCWLAFPDSCIRVVNLPRTYSALYIILVSCCLTILICFYFCPFLFWLTLYMLIMHRILWILSKATYNCNQHNLNQCKWMLSLKL